MPVTKVTISLPEDLAQDIRAEAAAEGTTITEAEREEGGLDARRRRP